MTNTPTMAQMSVADKEMEDMDTAFRLSMEVTSFSVRFQSSDVAGSCLVHCASRCFGHRTPTGAGRQGTTTLRFIMQPLVGSHLQKRFVTFLLTCRTTTTRLACRSSLRPPPIATMQRRRATGQQSCKSISLHFSSHVGQQQLASHADPRGVRQHSQQCSANVHTPV